MISCRESLLINEKKLPLFQERRGNIDRYNLGGEWREREREI
jgi:hypothetical protein